MTIGTGKHNSFQGPTLPIIDAHCHIMGFLRGLVTSTENPVQANQTGERIFGEPSSEGIVFYNYDYQQEWVLKEENAVPIFTGYRTIFYPGGPRGEAKTYAVIEQVYVMGSVEVSKDDWDLAKKQPKAFEISDPNNRSRFKGTVVNRGLIETDRTAILPSSLRYLSDEAPQAAECLGAVPREKDHDDSTAIVPLILDLAFTALRATPAIAKVLSKIPGVRLSAGRNQYYNPNRTYAFAHDNLHRIINIYSIIAKDNPGQVFPFLPYDPRRPDCLEYIKQSIGKLGFVGVKLYTRCGWMPYKNKEIYPEKLANDLDTKLAEFYNYCIAQDIPIINHTSPSGFPMNGLLVLPRSYHGPERSVDVPREPDPVIPNSIRYSSDLLNPALFRTCATWAVQRAIREAAYLAHYIQNTVSPYSWEPVLGNKKPNWSQLRLCFGHFGGELSWLHHFDDLVSDRERKEKDLELGVFSMVARGNRFREHFKRYVKSLLPCFPFGIQENPIDGKLVHEATDPVPGYAHEESGIYWEPDDDLKKKGGKALMEAEVEHALDRILNNAAWSKWFKTWESRYPVSWYEKIEELLETYPNVYTDISYLSGNETIYARMLQRLAELADTPTSNVLQEKVLYGTDWWMTLALDKITAEEMWSRFRKVIDAWAPESISDSHTQFDMWVSENTWRFLNLKRRIGEIDEHYAKSKKSPPQWWLDMRATINLK
jgi:hypothetical protein